MNSRVECVCGYVNVSEEEEFHINEWEYIKETFWMIKIDERTQSLPFTISILLVFAFFFFFFLFTIVVIITCVRMR